MSYIESVMTCTNWNVLREQKQDLLDCISMGRNPILMGLVHWIDNIQDAVVKDGYDEAVVFGKLED